MLPFDRMLPLTGEETESYKNQRFYYICRQEFYDVDDRNDKMIVVTIMIVMRNLIPKKFPGDGEGFDDFGCDMACHIHGLLCHILEAKK